MKIDLIKIWNHNKKKRLLSVYEKQSFLCFQNKFVKVAEDIF